MRKGFVKLKPNGPLFFSTTTRRLVKSLIKFNRRIEDTSSIGENPIG